MKKKSKYVYMFLSFLFYFSKLQHTSHKLFSLADFG